jgi:Zn-dependent peptidase ImmA (M78 family)
LAFPIRVPYRSYEEIGRISFDFLKAHDFHNQIPIDVEAILEFVLDVGIIPIPGFQQNYSVEGSLSMDLKTVYVDEHVYRAVETRYRFTLAHELGHILLHKSLYKDTDANSFIDWKRAYRMISESSYFSLEKQAYDFAGLLLVPADHLKMRFAKMISENKAKFVEADKKGVMRPKVLEYFMSQVIYRLGRVFNVSTNVIEKRIDRDNLIVLIP